ncbi:unnamed protein product [Musa textilis]
MYRSDRIPVRGPPATGRYDFFNKKIFFLDFLGSGDIAEARATLPKPRRRHRGDFSGDVTEVTSPWRCCPRKEGETPMRRHRRARRKAKRLCGNVAREGRRNALEATSFFHFLIEKNIFFTSRATSPREYIYIYLFLYI